MDKKDQPGWFDRRPIHVDEIARIEREEYAEFCHLPDDHVVFAERDGYMWVFLIADGTSEDPPVYMFSDDESREYRQVARSV